jgi:uncharacterized repeat protein (TIGR03943 family)
MRRETQNVLLVLLGGAVLKISLNGEYVRYVKPSLQPWLIAAGVFTIAVAVAGIVRDLRGGSSRRTADLAAHPADAHATDSYPAGAHPAGAHPAGGHSGHGHAGGDEHGHEHSSRSPWLLILPALAIFLVAPPALGADKVLRSESVIAAQPAGSDFVDLPEGDAPLLKLGDAVTRAVWDDSGSLDNREIRLVGFTVRTGDGTMYLARLTIGCCAADAAPIKLRLQGAGIDAYEPDTWLEVRGTMVPDTATEANGYVPTFAITSLTPVPAPEDQYEY